MKKILVFGNGQLGCELDQIKKDYPSLEIIIIARAEADISDLKSIESRVRQADFLINAAAYTAVDKAETEEKLAFSANTMGPYNLAFIAKKYDIPLIHVSTDYVFDGEGNSPYKTTDMPNPQSAYGRTKLAGELAIRSLWEKHYIVRTSWVYSSFGNNFVKTMLRLGAQRDELGIVSDQFGSPTNAKDLAHFLLSICQNTKTPYGSYNFSNEGICSWYEFAVKIFEIAKSVGLKTPTKVNPIESKDYPTPATRPKFSALFPQTLFPSQTWQEALENFLKVNKFD